MTTLLVDGFPESCTHRRFRELHAGLRLYTECLHVSPRHAEATAYRLPLIEATAGRVCSTEAANSGCQRPHACHVRDKVGQS